MKKLFTILLLLVFFQTHADNIDLFILAGQSNMQGWRSDAAQYPADKHHLDARIPFYYETINYTSSNKQWTTLKSQAGHFPLGHFGPEITLGRALFLSKMRPAIFKFSKGGSSLKMDWKAPYKHGLYDDMVASLQMAIQELEAQGHTVTPRAFIWVQGESDAINNKYATEYYWNLRRLIHHLRVNILRIPTLPVILSVDEQHPHVQQHPQVVDAQIKLSMEDPTISFVSMYDLEKSDVTHLTARGTIEQGKRIFEAYKALQN